MTSELDDYPVVVDLDVRWGDMDTLGHVNNTVFFQYLESSRIQYHDTLTEDGDVWPEGIGPILASTSCNFRLPIVYPDRLQVGARVIEIGEKKYVMDHVIYSEEHDDVAADGDATVVSFNYSEDQTAPLPDELIRRMEKREGKSF